MGKDDTDVLHALRRNGIGARVMVALDGLGACSVRRLSRVTGASPYRIRGAIEGRWPDCRPEHAIERLGFVERTARSRLVVLTPAGRAWVPRIRQGLVELDGVGRAYHRAEA
jgi:hypothetical protein